MTKQELKRYQYIKSECEQIREQIARIEAVIYSAKGQIITDMPKWTAEYDKMGLAIEKLEKLQNKYFSILSDLCEQQLGIENAISILSEREQILMRYRYLDGMDWVNICLKMNYEWAQIHRIHSNALEKLKHDTQ